MPFLDDLISKVRLDTGQYDEAQQRVVAGTRQIGQEGARASAVAGPPLNQMSAGYRGAASAALGASNAIGAFAGTQNRAVMAMQMVNIQAATMADALARTGGAVGGFAMALSRALPVLAIIGGAIALGVAAWNALTKSSKEAAEAMDAANKAAFAYSQTAQGQADAIHAVKDAERSRRNAQIIAELGREAGLKRIEELARAEAEAVQREARESERAAIRDTIIEAQRADAVRLAIEQEMGLRDAKGRTRQEAMAAAQASARAAAEEARIVGDAFERARALIVGLPEEVTPEQDLSAVRGAAHEMHQQQLLDEAELEERVDAIRDEMREKERARQEQRLNDQAAATAAWNATVRAETIAGAQAVGALALQAFLARKSFSDFSQAVAQLFLQKALMYSIEAGILAAAAAIPSVASPALWLQSRQSAQIAAAYGVAAGLFGIAGGGIGRASSGTSIRRGGGGTSIGTGGGGGVGLGFGARGGAGGGGDSIVINVRVEPGASPEDTGEATVRSIRAMERDRNRRVLAR